MMRSKIHYVFSFHISQFSLKIGTLLAKNHTNIFIIIPKSHENSSTPVLRTTISKNMVGGGVGNMRCGRSVACTANVSPCCCTGDDLQAAWIPDELVQNADNLFKLGSVVPVFLPAVQHQLIQGSWAVHGRREAVALIHCFNYLREEQSFQGQKTRNSMEVFIHTSRNILKLNKTVF